MTVHENFIQELRKRISEDEVAAFLETCQKPIKKSLTLNTYKIPVSTFLEITKKRGRHLKDPGFTQPATTFYIDRDDTSVALGNTFLHQAGFFYIQEVAASLPATQLQPASGNIILDIAAAPGWKSSQLAYSLLEQKEPGLVIANDVDRSRVKTLAHNLNKGGCYNTAITNFNGFSFGKNLPNFFDHVLVDAPCSWEGTRYKSDDALRFRKREEVNKIAGTQFQILISAIKATKPWGTVIYSTCTLNPYENEYIVQKILDFFGGDVTLEPHALHNTAQWLDIHNWTQEPSAQKSSAFDPQKIARLRPQQHGTWGFFIAVLRKHAPTIVRDNERDHKLLPKNQFTLDHSKKLQDEVRTHLKDNFWIVLDSSRHFFVASKEQIYITSPAFLTIKPHLQFEKIGIPVFKKDRDMLRPTHYLGNILGDLAHKNVISLSTEDAQRRSDGTTFTHEDMLTVWDEPRTEQDKKNPYPYRILQRQWYGFSLGKRTPEGLKNKFMK